MHHRVLGRSGLKVSEIIYGNWLTHGAQIDRDAAIACVRAALDAGITTFDTADAYADGAAELALGEALAGEPRASIEILTKVYWPTGRKGPNESGLSRKHILASIDASLARLGTDHVDLYQAHRYDVETPLEETMQAFADVVHAGKALYIGVSEWTADQLRRGQELATGLGFRLVSNQPQYSLLWQVIEQEVVPASRELGISQIVWSPLAQGVLTGKYRSTDAAPEGSRAADPDGAERIRPFLTERSLAAVDRLRPIADDLGTTLAQLAIAWVLSNDAIAGAIVGASRPEQISSNVAAADLSLDAETLARIAEAMGDAPERDPRRTAVPERRPS